MVLQEKNGLKFYQFEHFQDQKLFHAILTRHGGHSLKPYDSLNTGGTVGDDRDAVLKNHYRIYETLNYDFHSRFDVWQVHGEKVICADSPRPPDMLHEKADGILTDNPDITLFMRFADCVPILLFDPIKTVIGIIHAGWQGTAKQISRAAVEKMFACYGTNPQDILAGIGPSICKQCYQVGEAVRIAFEKSFGATTNRFLTETSDGLYLDLWEANKEILKNAGVNQIEVSEICTSCNTDDWYSHRAENGKTGRFGVLMTIENQ